MEYKARVTLGRKIPAEQYGSVDIRVEFAGDSPIEVEKLAIKEFQRLIAAVESGKINIGGKK